MAILDVTGLIPLDTKGLTPFKEEDELDVSGLTPLDVAGLTPLIPEEPEPLPQDIRLEPAVADALRTPAPPELPAVEAPGEIPFGKIDIPKPTPQKAEDIPKTEREQLSAIGKQIRESGLTAKQFAEKAVLGKEQEGFVAGLNVVVDRVRKAYPLQWAGKSIQMGRFLGHDELEGVKVMEAFEEAEKIKEQRDIQQEMENKTLAGATDFKTTGPLSTVPEPTTPPPLPSDLVFEGEDRLSLVPGSPTVGEPQDVTEIENKWLDLKKGGQEKIQAAGELMNKAFDLAKKVPEFGQQLVGGLVAEADEIALGLGAFKGVKMVAGLTETGKTMTAIRDMEKAVKKLTPMERVVFNNFLNNTRGKRLAMKAGDLGGEALAFTLPPALLEKGRLPTTSENLGALGAILGFRAISKAVGKGVQTITEALKVKVTPQMRENLVFEVAKRAEAEGMTPVEALKKARETVESSTDDQVRLVTRELKKEAKLGTTEPTKAPEAVTDKKVTEADAETTPPPSGPPVEETPSNTVPDEIIKPLQHLDKKITEAKTPELKEALEDNRSLVEDERLPGVVIEKVFKKSVRKMDEANIPYTYVRWDGRNLTGSNKKKGHPATDKGMEEMWSRVMQKEVEANGGLVTRFGKASDEGGIIFPYKTEAEVEIIMADISAKIDQRVIELGFDKIDHAKLKIPEYGSLGIDYGVAKGRRGKFGEVDTEADNLAIIAKERFEQARAKEKGYILDKEKGIYVKDTKIKTDRADGKGDTGTGVPSSGEKPTTPSKPSGQGSSPAEPEPKTPDITPSSTTPTLFRRGRSDGNWWSDSEDYVTEGFDVTRGHTSRQFKDIKLFEDLGKGRPKLESELATPEELKELGALRRNNPAEMAREKEIIDNILKRNDYEGWVIKEEGEEGKVSKTYYIRSDILKKKPKVSSTTTPVSRTNEVEIPSKIPKAELASRAKAAAKEEKPYLQGDIGEQVAVLTSDGKIRVGELTAKNDNGKWRVKSKGQKAGAWFTPKARLDNIGKIIPDYQKPDWPKKDAVRIGAIRRYLQSTKRSKSTEITGAEIQKFHEENRKIPLPVEKKRPAKTQSVMEQMERIRDRELADRTLAGEMKQELVDVTGYVPKDVSAKDLPKNFSVLTQPFSVLRPETKGINKGKIKINNSDQPYSKPWYMDPDKKVTIDNDGFKFPDKEIPDKLGLKEFETAGAPPPTEPPPVKTSLEDAGVDIDPSEIGLGDIETVLPRGKRKRGIFSQVGQLGKQIQTKLGFKKAERVNPNAQKFQDTMDRGYKEAIDRRNNRMGLNKIYNKAGSVFIQSEFELARVLSKTPEGIKAIHDFQRARGASSAANHLARQGKMEVYESIPHGNEQILANLTIAHRIIELDKVTAGRKGDALKLTKGQKDVLERLGDSPEGFAERVFKNPGGMTKTEAQAYIDEVKTQHPDMAANFDQALNRYWKVMQKQVKDLHKAGIITDEFNNYLLANHKHYSKRLFLEHTDPNRVTVRQDGSKVTVPDSGIEALGEGSEGALLNDPVLFIEQANLRTQTRIFKNEANKSLLDYVTKNPDNPLGIKLESPLRKGSKGELEVVGEFFEETAQFEKVPNGFTRITAMVEGKPQNMLMPDNVAQMWSLNDPVMNSDFANALKIMSGTPILRAMATGLNPEFGITNLLGDMQFTWFKQHGAYSAFMPVGLAQVAKDVKSVLPDVMKKKGWYEVYMLNGGGMDFLTSQGFLFKRAPGELPGAGSEFMEQIQTVMGFTGNTTEAAVRVGLMKRLIEKGLKSKKLLKEGQNTLSLLKNPSPEVKEIMLDAVHAARTNIDYGQGGTWTRGANNFIPYLNAGVQGTRGIFQAFKADPKIATAKAAQVTALATGLTYWANKMYPETMDKVSMHEKESGWIIPLPYSFKDSETGVTRHPYLKLKKDYGQRVFGSIGNGFGNLIGGKRVDFQEITKAFSDATNLEVFNQLPPSLKAMNTYILNKDFWRKRDIWKGRSVSPEMEFTEKTPKFWKTVGHATGMSPDRLDISAQQVFPINVYTDMMGAAWNAIQLDNESKMDINKTMWETMIKAPGMRRILRATYPFKEDELQIEKDVREFGVPTMNEAGNPRLLSSIIKDLNKAKLKANDAKQTHDNELKLIMIKESQSSEPKGGPEFKKFIDRIVISYGKVATDQQLAKEIERLIQRYTHGKKVEAIERYLLERKAKK